MKKIDEKVESYISHVKSYLKKEYGEIPSEYSSSLEMLETNYRIFLIAKQQIEKEGVIINDFRGQKKVHPAQIVMKDAQNALLKVQTQFSLTSYSRAKTKHIKEEETDVNLLDSLLNS